MTTVKSYSTATVVSAFSLVTQVALGLAVITSLAQLLPKSQFGSFIVALTAIQIAASVLSASVERTALFILSRNSQHDTDRGIKGELIAGSFIVGFVGTLTAYLVLFIGSLSFTRDQAWIIWPTFLAPLIFATCVNATVSACLRAQQHTIAFALLQYATPSIIRFMAVSLITFSVMPATPSTIAVAFILAAGFPAVIGGILVSPKLSWPSTVASKKNTKYAVTMMLAKLTSEPNRTLDVVLVGSLTTSSIAADYGLASRIAIALSIAKQALDSLLVPRIGMLYSDKKYKTLLKEYSIARDIGVSILIIGSIAFSIFGPAALSYLEGYQDSYPLVLLLAAAAAVRIGFGSTGNYLNMTGRPSLSLVASLTGVGTLLLSSFILIPMLGASGGAAAVMLSQACMHTAAVMITRQIDGIYLISPFIILCVASTTIILILIALDYISLVLSSTLLFTILALLLTSNARDLHLLNIKREKYES